MITDLKENTNLPGLGNYGLNNVLTIGHTTLVHN